MASALPESGSGRTSVAASPGSPYTWFAAGAGAWALAAGMQQVLFAWLIVGELREEVQWVGAAQMCQSLPALLFVLAGGVVADRFERRRFLMWLHAAAAFTVLLLAAAVATGRLDLAVLLGYALAWGTLFAFAQPARDAILSEVTRGDLMRAITGVTLIQFVGQALGARLAGLGAWLGVAGALALQAALFVLGMFTVARLPTGVRPISPGEKVPRLTAMGAGLREVWRSRRLRPIALLVGGNGLFFMGPFAVLCPVIVRDIYHGGIDDLSIVMMTLPIGTIVGSSALLLRRAATHKGQAFLVALVGVSACLVTLALRPPFWGFIAILFVWGVFHALFFNTSRALFQEAAPPSHRARVLSVHSLGFFGMAPLSHLGAGALATLTGPLAACALAGGAMILATTLAFVFTPVARLK